MSEYAEFTTPLPRARNYFPAEPKEAIPVNLLIAKQRNGPTGDVCLTFLKSFTRFESAAKVDAED